MPGQELGERFREALEYALRLHAGQKRKGTEIPYVAHLLAVCALVLEHGGGEDEVVAALLHDAVEDRGDQALLAEIKTRFGPKVAEIVAGCSDAFERPKPPWRERKERALAHTASAPAHVLLVEAADKLHNARAVLEDYRVLGEKLWERFTAGREARALGLIIGDRNLDYTNPAAVEWHSAKIREFLERSGVEGWKLDRGDEYNPSRRTVRYFDGRSGFAVHNDYPRLYIKTFYDATRAVRGEDFVLMARPAYTGTSAWSIVWGGDTYAQVTDWLGRTRSTDLGLRSVIISLQRMAMMGYPVWGSDTGGYHPFRDREVFARWLQVSCFCPLMEIGGVGPHEPWNMPTEPAYDEEMITIYRRYTQLHARLADYLYALAERAHQTGNPIVHPLVFDWPDDPAVKDRWDEYMFGPALLVAPVWKSGAREREVYLPEGEWVNFWDERERWTGPVTITVAAPLDLIPVFIKADQAHLLPADLLHRLDAAP